MQRWFLLSENSMISHCFEQQSLIAVFKVPDICEVVLSESAALIAGVRYASPFSKEKGFKTPIYF
jgi:hypothetical protein